MEYEVEQNRNIEVSWFSNFANVWHQDWPPKKAYWSTLCVQYTIEKTTLLKTGERQLSQILRALPLVGDKKK